MTPTDPTPVSLERVALKEIAEAEPFDPWDGWREVRRLRDIAADALDRAERAAQPSAALREALLAVNDDWHPVSTRPCPTCDPISKLIGVPFGCTRYRRDFPGQRHTDEPRWPHPALSPAPTPVDGGES